MNHYTPINDIISPINNSKYSVANNHSYISEMKIEEMANQVTNLLLCRKCEN
jgi:hypothetical protein